MRKRVKPQRNQQSQYRPLRTNETPLFSIPFYTMRWENAPLSQICTDVRKSIKEIEARPNDDGTRRGVQSNEDLETNYTTYFHRDIHQDFIEDTPWYRDLATQLKDTYIDILFHRFNKPVDYISRENVHLFLWVNLYTKEHLHMYHNHKGSVLSGTFYVETSPPCAPIVFVNPTESHNFIFMSNDSDMEDGQRRYSGVPAIQTEFQYQPNNGDICMWPSYLYHSVPRCPNQDERISISFNLAHHDHLGFGHGDEILEPMSYDFLKHEQSN